MLHINDLTVNNIFTGNEGEDYRVVANLSDNGKIYVELEKVEPVGELIEEI